MSTSKIKQDLSFTKDVEVGEYLKLSTGTLAAAGSTNADAAAIAKQVTYVTASDDTKGVILPVVDVGTFIKIHNTVAGQNLKVYPPALGTINGGTATTGSVLVAALETATFHKVSSTAWHGGVAVNF